MIYLQWEMPLKAHTSLLHFSALLCLLPLSLSSSALQALPPSLSTPNPLYTAEPISEQEKLHLRERSPVAECGQESSPAPPPQQPCFPVWWASARQYHLIKGLCFTDPAKNTLANQLFETRNPLLHWKSMRLNTNFVLTAVLPVLHTGWLSRL